jgi:PKD repeat protein
MNLKGSTLIITILVMTNFYIAFDMPIIPENISNINPNVEIEDIKLNNISILGEEMMFFTGTENYSLMGISVSNAGDVNNDGFDDVIVGAPSHDTFLVKGNAYIYFGGYLMDNTEDVILTGEGAGDIFGQSVSAAGDVNGDGFDDVIVGAPFNDTRGHNAGKAYIYYGGDPMDNIPDIIMTGNETSAAFGLIVSQAGDLNGDGFDDVMVASPHANARWDLGYAGHYGEGNVSIFFGGNPMDNVTDLVITYVPQPYTGGYTQIWDISCTGDVNDDGFDDVIVGRPFESYSGGSGRAYIYLGGDPMDNSSDLILTGEGLYDRFGNGIAGAGDVNNDGYDDFIIGAPSHDLQHSTYIAIGRAYVYYGSNTLNDTPDVILDADAIAPSDLYGWSVSGAGDVNKDGYTDVIVGASSCYEGRAYVYYGGELMDNTSDIIMVGEDIGDQFGFSVSTAGDTNCDGYDDVIIGAYTNVPADKKRGKAYLRISPYVVANEGDNLHFIGNFTDLDVDDAHTIEWDFGDGSTSSGNLTPFHAYGDNGVYNPTLTVTDNQGGVGSKSMQVIVNNVAPIADAGGPYSGKIGEPVSIQGSCYDPGFLDTHTFTWDMYGNAIYGDRIGANITWTWNSAGTFYIVLKVIDDDGGVDYDLGRIDIQPLNQPPIADVNGPYYGYEGSLVVFNASTSYDPDGDILEYRWDFNNNGIWDTGWSSNTYSEYTWYDDYHGEVVVEVSDAEFTDIDTTTVTVYNVAPIVNTSTNQTIDEGDTVYLSGSFTDPGWNDTHTIEWNFGDGETATGTLNTSHIYGDDGEFTVTLTVTDDDGGVGVGVLTVIVNNIPPIATIESVTMNVEIGLRVAGRKYNNVSMTLYEEGIEIGQVSIERLPGSPNEQMAWIPYILDMTKTYSVTVTYEPEDPPNIGGNPVWIYIKFENGSIRKIHHTFNVQQSKKRDSDHWNHIDPWEVDLNAELIGCPFEVKYHVTDPGSDDEFLTFSYGTQTKNVTYLNDPPNMDPYPSPEINPVDFTEVTTLIYEGSGTIILTGEDDDEGTASAAFDIL